MDQDTWMFGLHERPLTYASPRTYKSRYKKSITKLELTLSIAQQKAKLSQNTGVNNKQIINNGNNNGNTTLERTAAEATGVGERHKLFYWPNLRPKLEY